METTVLVARKHDILSLLKKRPENKKAPMK